MPLGRPQHSGKRLYDADDNPIYWSDVLGAFDRPNNSYDFAGRQSFNTVFGESVVGWHMDSISAQFQYNISSRDVSTQATGSGLVIHSSERAGASISTSVGDCTIQTVDSLRYRPGHEVTAQFTSVYVGAQVGVNHYHGVLNGADGFAFGTKDGVFGIWYLSSGVETFVPQSDWLGDKLDGSGDSGVTLDPTAMNLYQVQYGWLGIAPAVLSVYCGFSRGWCVVHWIDRTGMQSTPHIRNPALPLKMRTVRASGSGTAAAVYSASMRAGVTSGEGEDNASNRWFAETRLEASITGVNVRNNVFQLTNAATFQGKANHVTLELAVVTFDNSGNKTVAFFGTKGATVTGGSAAVLKDSTNSVVSVITGGTLTGGAQGPATVIKAGSDRRTDVLGTGIKVYPGETFAFEAVAASTFSGTISLSARWVEYF